MKQTEITFAKRFDGVSGSAIRDIFKLLGVPGMISFAGGNPAESALEDDVISELAVAVMEKHGKKLLQYGATEGWPPYRAQTARFLKEDIGIEVAENELLPTTGSTQAIDLLLKALINPGDTILVEGPSFLGSLQAMKLYQANLVPVPMDEGGIMLDALEDAIKQHKPKILYTVPNFQNPTGVTMVADRRKAIAELAEKYDFLVAEDDPYRGLRYYGEPQPTIFSFDESARVVYLTSFSKLVSPGLRTGAIVTRHPELLRKLTVGKQSTDVQTPGLTQAIVAEYIARDLLPEHIKTICAQYKTQLDRMVDAFATFPEGVKVVRPDGGLFVWAELPERYNATKMFTKAAEKGVAYVPGTHFFAHGGHDNTMRLNFSNSSLDQIDRGMDLIKQCILEEG